MRLTWNAIGLVAIGIIGIALLLGLPRLVGLYTLLQLTVYLVMGMLAMSLALVWGIGGIFSFGQATFFGLGGYAYAVAAFNMSDSTIPMILGVVTPTAFALLLGYVLFYGRLSSVYLAIITLTVTLIFFTFLGHTAGYEYSIGKAHLGGYNGMPSIPPINLPGNPEKIVYPEDMFTVVVIVLMIVYFGVRIFLISHFGRVVVAIRENETRAALQGYDTRFYKLVTFAIGGAIAGVAGVLFANWNAYISPTVFSLQMSAQIIIWVIVGGLGTLVGPILGAMVLGYAAIELGTQQSFDVNLILGVILIVFVLLVPKGIVPQIQDALVRAWEGRRAHITVPETEGEREVS